MEATENQHQDQFNIAMYLLKHKLPKDLQLNILRRYTWGWGQEKMDRIDEDDWFTTYYYNANWFPDFARWDEYNGIIDINVNHFAECKSRSQLLLFTQILDRLKLIKTINFDFNSVAPQYIHLAETLINRYYGPRQQIPHADIVYKYCKHENRCQCKQ